MASNARDTDPVTSHLAARQLSEKDRTTVRLEFYKPPHRMTDFELGARLGGDMNGRWRKRRCDLTRDKIIIWSGEKKLNPRTGQKCNVWQLAVMPDDLNSGTVLPPVRSTVVVKTVESSFFRKRR